MTLTEISNDNRYEIEITRADIEEANVRSLLDFHSTDHADSNPLVVALRRTGFWVTRTDGNFLYDKEGVVATLSSVTSRDYFIHWMRCRHALPHAEWFKYLGG